MILNNMINQKLYFLNHIMRLLMVIQNLIIYFFLNIKNKDNINFLLKSLFHKFKAGVKLVFQGGNIFWAATKAIYQIFNIRFKYPKKLGQTNETYNGV